MQTDPMDVETPLLLLENIFDRGWWNTIFKLQVLRFPHFAKIVFLFVLNTISPDDETRLENCMKLRMENI